MKEYWNDLFESRDKEFSHEPYLDEDMKSFKPSKLLDIGAGDGRNTFFFLNNGFDVTCLDYSDTGIRKIQRKAHDRNLSVDVRVANIFTDDLFQLNQSFDTISMIHFFPDIVALEKVLRFLKPEGLLYCLTFINDNLDRNCSKYEIGISKGEIKTIHEKFTIAKEEYRTDPRGDFYCFYLRNP